eukprot:g18.t1
MRRQSKTSADKNQIARLEMLVDKLLECDHEFLKEKTTYARVIARSSAILKILSHRRTHIAFQKWRNFTETQESKIRGAAKIMRLWSKLRKIRYLRLWTTYHVTAKHATFKKKLKEAENVTSEQRRDLALHKLVHALRVHLQRDLNRSFFTWRYRCLAMAVATRVRTRRDILKIVRTAGRIVRNFQRRELASAWKKWRSEIVHGKALRDRHVKSVVLALRSWRSFRVWTSVSRIRRDSRARLKRVALHIASRWRAKAFRRWLHVMMLAERAVSQMHLTEAQADNDVLRQEFKATSRREAVTRLARALSRWTVRRLSLAFQSWRRSTQSQCVSAMKALPDKCARLEMYVAALTSRNEETAQYLRVEEARHDTLKKTTENLRAENRALRIRNAHLRNELKDAAAIIPALKSATKRANDADRVKSARQYVSHVHIGRLRRENSDLKSLLQDETRARQDLERTLRSPSLSPPLLLRSREVNGLAVSSPASPLNLSDFRTP